MATQTNNDHQQIGHGKQEKSQSIGFLIIRINEKYTDGTY